MQLQGEILKLFFCITNNEREKGNSIETGNIFDFSFLVYQNFFFVTSLITKYNQFLFLCEEILIDKFDILLKRSNGKSYLEAIVLVLADTKFS